MENDFPVERFATAFQEFIENVNALAPEKDEGAPTAGRRVSEFLGAEPRKLSIAKAQFRARDLATIQLAVEALLESPGWESELLGYTVEHDSGFGLARVLSPTSYDPVREGPPVYRSVELPNRAVSALEQGLYLTSTPLGKAALLQHLESNYGRTTLRVECVALDPATAQQVIDRVIELAKKVDVLRGSVISLGADEAEDVSFHRIPSVTRDELILPASVIAAIERTTVGLSSHADRLLAAGRHLKRGLLLHGPPGTGKSLAVSYLIGQMPERTVIVLTGRVLGLIKMSCELARHLAPATVVLEDVDLVAEDRTREPQCGPLLFELMNEMDGLAGDADIIFLLTTNRPEALEPALASRPGRIDQAIEFPLPDEECRQRLFALYGNGLALDRAEIDDMVARTEGVSPAFIKELLRRAALNAALRTTSEENLEVSHQDLMDALHEILLSGGPLTARLLGASQSAALRD